MITPDSGMCRYISARVGLPTGFVAKEFYLFNLMEGIMDSWFADELIFKGGTALNAVYLENLRFSEDLDFDLAKEAQVEEAQKYVKEIGSAIHGFSGMEPHRAHKTYMLDFIYDSPFGRKDRVRMDIRFGAKSAYLEKPRSRPMKSGFTGQSISGVPVYGLEDLLARKMNALAGRDEGRDVFDVANAFTKADSEKLRKAIGIMLKSDTNEADTDGFLAAVADKLDRADYTAMMKLTNPYIPIESRPTNWKILGADLKGKIRTLLSARGQYT